MPCERLYACHVEVIGRADEEQAEGAAGSTAAGLPVDGDHMSDRYHFALADAAEELPFPSWMAMTRLAG